MSTEGPPTENLYVQNLPHDITEQTIQQIFAAVGYRVAQSKVLKAQTPGATCVAMVRFESKEEAMKVRDNFDGTLLPGFDKPLLIRYAGNKPAAAAQTPVQLTDGNYGRAPMENTVVNGGKGGSQPYTKAAPEPSDNIYIKGLPPVADEAFVRELFGSYGTVTQCKVLRKNAGEPCHALVRFSSIDEATTIKSQLNGGILEGSTDKLSIEFAAKKKGTDWQGAASWGAEGKGSGSWGKGGFDPAMMGNSSGSWGKGGFDPAMMGNSSGSWGKGGLDPAMMGNSSGSWGKGSFEPANFLGDGGAKGGMKGSGMTGKDGGMMGCSMKGETWGQTTGMEAVVSGFKASGILPGSGAEKNGDTALYVSGLPHDCENYHLYQLFAPFGPIALGGVTAVKNPDGSCKGIGFINYLDWSSLDRASQALDGAPMPNGQPLKVQAKTKKGPGAATAW